ncbi:phenylacetic acid degradation operon negative regulatory protein PaaX [Marinobacterium nitratireducens]|uniref:Phenylacetic acid degradation operon negative regulatory protein PaaX n=1 Tax=Marinobacterium nitratireducens TaxID=518897 RepID=A0A917ZCL9_9GAMM|nr:phenylacetic acid degradation operon negative regulatory protein PaaX [Marinobacterium nitratireducens]GGO79357.1 phenylacetic acid degradation operon negative regulatory protein PaaX [Marinobacterium nitratireducens]
MSSSSHLNELVRQFCQQRPIRAGSLIITIFGDAIAPRGGTVWLGSLIQVLESLGLNQRLVRTSVFRLSKEENWLSAEQVGRRAYYSVTSQGRRRFDKAFKRIYAPVLPEWDGSWCLVVLSQLPTEKRQEVRDELQWMGFGAFSPTLMAAPNYDMLELRNTLQELDALDGSILFETRQNETSSSRALREQSRECWNLDQISDSYRQFLDRFRPVWQELKNKDSLDPQECFIARTLMIHEYRKLLLRDPQLPAELLPPDWSGVAARQLCRNLYSLVCGPSEVYIGESMETAEGPLPEPTPAFYKRFGGLKV